MKRETNTLFILILISFFLQIFMIAPVAAVDGETVTANSPELIFLNTYHTHPPFFIEENKGLSYDLATYLTAKADGRYKFVVKAMSRLRVNKTIAEAESGVVPWVNPVWFKDVEEKKYMWTKGALMEDGNAIISHRENKVIYESPQSLRGMIFGGVRGHVYQGIDDYIQESKQLVRVNAENHIDNFRKLTKRRIDVTLMPTSGAHYLIKRENLGDTLYISPGPHSRFQRRAIIINNRTDILQYLEEILAGLDNNQEWKKIMESYR